MSESAIQTESKMETQTTYLKNYEVPDYLIDETDLHFDLNEDFTLVTSKLRIRHNRLSTSKSRNLILSGEELILESLMLNGKPITDYQITEDKLTIHQVPDNFELEIKTRINPKKKYGIKRLVSSSQYVLHAMRS